jgi:hypothetical protein
MSCYLGLGFQNEKVRLSKFGKENMLQAFVCMCPRIYRMNDSGFLQFGFRGGI